LFVEEDIKQEYEDTIIEITKKYYSENPNMFQQYPNASENILEELKLKPNRLQQHPDIFKAISASKAIPKHLKGTEA
jgi:hypothetical protein